MNNGAKRSILIAGALLSGLTAAPVWAGETSLLVVVEAPPELGIDAGEIRRAIASELRGATVALDRRVSDASEHALIVSVDRERITMSLRESAATPVTRVIPSPGDPSARLHAITWLAGNLARDQVSGIVATPPDPPPPAPTAPPPASLPDIPPATLPDVPAVPSPSVETIVAKPAAAGPPAPATWTIGVAAGPGLNLYMTGSVLHEWMTGSLNNFDQSYPALYRANGTVWRIEGRRYTEGSRVFTGLALEGSNIQLMDEVVGATAFVGRTWRRGRWAFQGTLGAGIDLARATDLGVSTNAFGSTVSYDPTLRPGLYGAAGLSASHPFFESIDWVVSVDAHVSVMDKYDEYLASLFGLRYQL